MGGKVVPSEIRFWKYVTKSDGCWLWTGHVSNGYGRLSHYDGDRWVSIFAHRFSFELHFGIAPASLLVCHRCDNRLCVNPEHLFLGPPAANSRDMTAKGRQAKGERIATVKLSEEQVKEMRGLRRGGLKLRELSDQFGVSVTNVSDICQGLIWKHV